MTAQTPLCFEGSDVEKTTKYADLTSAVSSEIRVLTDMDNVTEKIKEEEPQAEKVELLVPWRDENFQSKTRYDRVN